MLKQQELFVILKRKQNFLHFNFYILQTMWIFFNKIKFCLNMSDTYKLIILMYLVMLPKKFSGVENWPLTCVCVYLLIATVRASGELAQGQMTSGLKPLVWKTLRKASQDEIDPERKTVYVQFSKYQANLLV